jgi:acyl dehydratase|tara:strand:+ start:853 stop:1986 length:1134 start_codon:yes stop_codon:yes gene_type:complete
VSIKESDFPRITEEELNNLRSRIGVKISRDPEPWCYEATRDNIRHYAHGIGDDNPLWCEPDYATQTKYNSIIALPSFLFATSRIASGYVGGLPGIHAMWAGANWKWHSPVFRNDEISTESHLKDLIEHQTQFAGRAIQQIYHVDFFNQSGVCVAECDSWCFRTERDTAREQGTKYNKIREASEKRYSQQELDDIFQNYANEEIRGSKARYYEDITIGETLPRMVKGPMTITGFIAYAQGWGGLYIRANKLAWKQVTKHSGLGIPNRFNIPDCPERVHWENEFATKVGAPGAYDYGPERCSWMTHHITNWIGDDGFLISSDTKIRRHNPEGDTLFIEGKVTDKFEKDGKGIIEITHEARNQDGELSILGTATAKLPRK